MSPLKLYEFDPVIIINILAAVCFLCLVLSRLYKLTFAGIGVAGAAVHEKAGHISKSSFLVSLLVPLIASRCSGSERVLRSAFWPLPQFRK